MASDLFCWPYACVFVLFEHMAFVLFLCAMCSHVYCLDPAHLVTWLLVHLPHLCFPRYPPHLLPIYSSCVCNPVPVCFGLFAVPFFNAHKRSHSTCPSVTAGSWPCHSPSGCFSSGHCNGLMQSLPASNCTAIIHENPGLCAIAANDGPGAQHFHCFHAPRAEERPSSVMVGICVKNLPTAGLSPPLSPQGHAEVTGTVWRPIYIDQLTPVLFMVFICRGFPLQTNYKSPKDSI